MSASLPAASAVRLAVADALEVIRPDRLFAVAFSGGLDSTVLLDAFVHAAGSPRCLALHIHHGLSPNADHWQSHCRAQSMQRDVRFVTANVDLSAYKGMGIEAAARLARYQALHALAVQHGADVLVLGQHADDQAETVLLQMLRGAGLAGWSAMPAQSTAHRADVEAMLSARADRSELAGVPQGGELADGGPATLLAQTLPLIRPLLQVRRAALEAYAQTEGLHWIEDESNQDLHFARNALRHDVLPALERHFPAYRQTLSRVARHAAGAQMLFDDLANLDLDRCLIASPQLADNDNDNERPGAEAAVLLNAKSACLSRTALQSLSAERLANLLRFWVRQLGLRAASAARLDEMVVQLQGLRRCDVNLRLRHREQSLFGRVSIRHDGLVLHGYRNVVFWSAIDNTLLAAERAQSSSSATLTSHYDGSPCWHLPEWRGNLLVSAATVGDCEDEHKPVLGRTRFVLPAAMFEGSRLSARKRAGGERLSLGTGRPSRSLKHLFQEAGVPTWQRDVPLFYLDDALIFVPYLGGSVRAVEHDAPTSQRVHAIDSHIVLEWQPI